VHLPPGLPAPKSAPIGGSITGSLDRSVSGSMDTGVTGGVSGGSAPPKDAFEEGVKVGYALTGKMPVVAQAPQSRAPQAPPTRAERAARQAPVRGDNPTPLADNPTSASANAATGLRSSLRGGAARGGTPERSTAGNKSERVAGTRAARRAQAAAASPDTTQPAQSGAGAGSGAGGDRVPSAPVSSVRPGVESRPTPTTPPRLAPSRSSLGTVSSPPQAEPAAEPSPSTRRRSRTDRFAASAQPDGPAQAYPPSGPSPSAGPTYPPPPPPAPQPEENLWQPPSYDGSTAYSGADTNDPDFEITQPRYNQESTYSGESAFAPALPTYDYAPEPAAGYGDQGGYGYNEQPGYEQRYADDAAPAAAAQNPWESGGYMAGPDDGYGQTAFAPDPYPSSAPEAPARPVPPSESIRASTPMLFEEEDDPDLEALARSIGTPTRIVWSRPRRNQHFEALLLPDGAIELSNGARYRHPDSAATAASGSYTADGWSVWRLGDTGPTLVEEFSRRFA
jgi:hypothetical protein